MKEIIMGHLERHLAAVQLLAESDFGVIERVAATCLDALRAGHKILWCGNGGSAADAQHLAAELVVRYRQNRRAFAAMALTTDTSVLTAGANDLGYERVFARQVEALGNVGDVLIGISTAGRSANVLAAMQAARDRGLVTVAFCGARRGPLADGADLVFAAPTEETARVQECHLLVGHIVCDLIEIAMQKPE